MNDIETVLRLWHGNGRFIDPFVGGGSISHLTRQVFPHVSQIVADANRWLVAAYSQARSGKEYKLPENFTDIAYWRGLTDAAFDQLSMSDRATRFAVCLQSSWGNRWKTGADGAFTNSAPVKAQWCNAQFLRPKIEDMFRGHWLHTEDDARHNDWRVTVADARPGDLVYIDPPYPESLGYGNQWWSFSDALDVVDWVTEADPKIAIVVSNMDTLRRLYERIGMQCVIVTGPTAMKTRRPRCELLAHNMTT